MPDEVKKKKGVLCSQMVNMKTNIYELEFDRISLVADG